MAEYKVVNRIVKNKIQRDKQALLNQLAAWAEETTKARNTREIL